MAYNVGYNADALPAHPEPDQAAQLLAYQSQLESTSRPHANSNPPPPTGQLPQSAYQNKPPPPTPPNLHQAQPFSHRRPSPNSSNLNPSYNANGGALPSSSQSHYYGSSINQYSGPSPQQSSHPPASHVGGGEVPLFPLFKSVDKRGTGQLTEVELRSALLNGGFASFDPQTLRMMIQMFDINRSGTIGFDEFCGLWGFLAAWRTLFIRFDEDGSGAISLDEYSKALVAFGYSLSPTYVNMMYRHYDKRGHNQMSFDIFVQSCISLKRMTDVFKNYDNDRDGYITLSFEEFLTEILLQT